MPATPGHMPHGAQAFGTPAAAIDAEDLDQPTERAQEPAEPGRGDGITLTRSGQQDADGCANTNARGEPDENPKLTHGTPREKNPGPRM